MSKLRTLIGYLGGAYVLAVIFFLWGIAAGNSGVFPWRVIEPFYDEVYAALTFQETTEKSVADKFMLHRLQRRVVHEEAGFHIHDKSFSDDGYLLLSRYDKELDGSTVELFSLAEQKILHIWDLPRKEIEKRAKGMRFRQGYPLDSGSFRALHPLLMDDGSIVYNAGLPSPLVRSSACGDIIWLSRRNFHHSNELDTEGNILSPIIVEGEDPTVVPIINDGWAVVSAEDGSVLEEHSVTELLLENGYRGIVYGIGNFNRDVIHLNDAQPVLFDTEDAKVGDVLLSSRHLSTVALFDHVAGNFKWLETGPWLNQHDINQLPDGRYSIYGNDVINAGRGIPTYVDPEVSDIYIYNPHDRSIEQPYTDVVREHQIGTPSSGRSRILDNGDAYIEATDNGRIVRISTEGIRWEYMNSISKDTIGLVTWSRYLAADEIDLQWLEGLSCDN